MNLAPIILFVYNRPWHTCQTVETLRKNDLAGESDLYIYSDGSKNEQEKTKIEEVREYIRSIDGFKSIKIIERKENLGLANSVISGVTEIVNMYGRVIVMEDDVVSSKYFLDFMNNVLEFYKNDMRIFSVTGINYLNIPTTYNYDVYLSYRGSSWGWGTWKNRWEKADWAISDYKEFIGNKEAQNIFNRAGEDVSDMLISQMNGNIDSWGIRWLYTQFKNDAFTLFPVHNLINNIGFDGTGTHCGKGNYSNTEINDDIGKIELVNNIELSDDIVREFKAYFKRGLTGKIKRFLKKVGLF
ncbi:MAG: glycosyltransferase [Armatimonadetes bacterium]|nr:glycosyltransferase [Armatimonadota bacterium]